MTLAPPAFQSLCTGSSLLIMAQYGIPVQEGAVNAVMKGVQLQHNIALFIARFLCDNLPIDKKPEELVGPVIVTITILTGIFLYKSLSFGISYGEADDGGGPQAQKKEQ